MYLCIYVFIEARFQKGEQQEIVTGMVNVLYYV